MVGKTVIYKPRIPETTVKKRTKRVGFRALLLREPLLYLVSRKGLRKLLWKTSDSGL